MNAILHNPHHYSGAMVARVGVASVTALWSLIVLSAADALAPTSYGDTLTAIGHEDTFGAVLLALSSGLLLRAFSGARPRWYIETTGYFALFGAWGFVDAVIWISHRPLQPTSASTVTLTTALALYAALAMPRGYCRATGD